MPRPRVKAARGRAAARWLRRSAAPNSLRRASPRPARKNSPALRCGSNSFREHETYARLDPRASRALVAVLGRGLTRRRRLGFIRATARPCAALQPPPSARHRWRATMSLQRRARPGRGANEAQAPAPDGLAAQRRSRAPAGAERASRTYLTRKACLNRNEVKVSCFARAARPAGAGNSVESRAAALPNAVAIAPRPGRARRCRSGQRANWNRPPSRTIVRSRCQPSRPPQRFHPRWCHQSRCHRVRGSRARGARAHRRSARRRSRERAGFA